MRKHVLGFGIFNLIFASFALVYAFFYAPAIPPKETVKPPIAQIEQPVERPYTCQLKRNKISLEVQSVELDVENQKFTAQLTINWNGNGTLPQELYVEPQLFTLDDVEKSVQKPKVLVTKTLVEPFKNSYKLTVLIKSDAKLDYLVTRDTNIYVVFSILDSENGNYLLKANKSLVEAHQVLVNYGKSSMVKPVVMPKRSNSLH